MSEKRDRMSEQSLASLHFVVVQAAGCGTGQVSAFAVHLIGIIRLTDIGVVVRIVVLLLFIEGYMVCALVFSDSFFLFLRINRGVLLAVVRHSGFPPFYANKGLGKMFDRGICPEVICYL